MQNMALAHEIAVDQDFKLEPFEPPDNRYLNISLIYLCPLDFCTIDYTIQNVIQIFNLRWIFNKILSTGLNIYLNN